MNISCNGTKNQYGTLCSSLRPLSGTFGDDLVCESYDSFYNEENRLVDDLESVVKIMEQTASAAQGIDAEGICNKATALINEAKSYPSVS